MAWLTHQIIRNNAEKFFYGIEYGFYGELYIIPLKNNEPIGAMYDFKQEVDSVRAIVKKHVQKDFLRVIEELFCIPIEVFSVYVNVKPEVFLAMEIGKEQTIKRFEVLRISNNLLLVKN